MHELQHVWPHAATYSCPRSFVHSLCEFYTEVRVTVAATGSFDTERFGDSGAMTSKLTTVHNEDT